MELPGFKKIIAVLLALALVLPGQTNAIALGAEIVSGEENMEPESQICSNDIIVEKDTTGSGGKTYTYTPGFDGNVRICFKVTDYNGEAPGNVYWRLSIDSNQESDVYSPDKFIVGDDKKSYKLSADSNGSITYTIKVESTGSGYYDIPYCIYTENEPCNWEKEGNNRFADANVIRTDEDYAGNTLKGQMDSDDQDWYRFVAEKNGYFTVTVQSVSDLTQTIWHMGVFEGETAARVLEDDVRVNYDTGEKTTYKYSMVQGQTYYISMKEQSCNKGSAYRFRVNTVEREDWERENNDTAELAQSMMADQVYFGSHSVNAAYDTDCYKFTAPFDGYFTVEFGPQNGSSSWKLSITDEDGILRYMKRTDCSNTSTYQIPMTQGKTYHLSLKGDTQGQEYSVSVHPVSAAYWEKENNDTREKANVISANQIYTGCHEHIDESGKNQEDVDYYTCTIEQDGYITVDARSFHTGNGICYVNVYRGTEKVIEDAMSSSIRSFGKVPVVSGDVIYVEIKNWNITAGDQYQFQVNAVASDCWEKEPNETKELATPILADCTYYGNLTLNRESDDYFIFQTSTAGEYKVRFGAASIPKESYDAWEIIVFDESAKVIKQVKNIQDVREICTIQAKPNKKYYFKVTSYETIRANAFFEYQLAVLSGANMTGENSDGAITVRFSDYQADGYEYTGAGICPKVSVYNGTQLLETSEYTVKYANNVKLSKYAKTTSKLPRATVTLKESRKSYTLNFKITERDIAFEEIAVTCADKAYNGKRQKSMPVVIFRKKKLKNNRDYIVSFQTEDLVQKGTVTVKITGKGNFKGSVYTTYRIVDSLASGFKVSKIKAIEYDGSEIIPEIQVSAKVNRTLTTLVENRDYTVTFLNGSNKNAGKAVMEIRGIGNFGGVKKVTFQIKKKSLTKNVKDIEVQPIPVQEYTGAPVKPLPEIRDKKAGQDLVYGRDYSLSYSRNCNPTTESKKAMIKIKGKGNYSGTMVLSFEIR